MLFYLWQLGGVGLLGPDEPRYASIGRAMAATGDWITPRLDGQPWFEKPPLTYWLTDAGHRLRLSDEWAARLPQELLSVLFLCFYFQVLAREFSLRLATAATAILATSAGWFAYSFAALTDLPMSVALGAAMLITLFDTRPKRGWWAGAFLGFAILAKGFVPLVLFAPLFLIARGKRLAVIAGAIIVAAPWYGLCWIRNGHAFWDDFFWKQHVARFLTPSLEHVQPWWFYVPVLLAGLFPWTPLAALLFRRRIYDDSRLVLLMGWVLYGFLFFSVARNKLPGYLLPLLPVAGIVLAAGLEKLKGREYWLAACAVMLVALPSVIALLPNALLAGVSRTSLRFLPVGLFFLVLAGVVWWLAHKDWMDCAVIAIAVATAICITYGKYHTFPRLDQTVSVRGFWRANRAAVDAGCFDYVNRTWEYGLNYYAGHALPECGASPPGPHIEVRDRRLAVKAAPQELR